MIKELKTFKHLLNTIPGFKEVMELNDKDIAEISNTRYVRDNMYFKKVNTITESEIYVNSVGTIVIEDGVIKNVNYIKTNKTSNSLRGQVYVNNRHYYVYRLVALAFITNPNPKLYKFVCHLNGDTKDDFYKNLVWGNAKTYTELNRKNYPHLHDIDYRHDDSLGTCKLNKNSRFDIASRLDDGELAKDLAAEYNVSDMTITRIRQKYCKNKTASIKYTKNTKKIIAQMFEDGKHSDKVIANISGIRYETVWRWRKKWKDDKFPEDDSIGLNGQKLKTGKKLSKLYK